MALGCACENYFLDLPPKSAESISRTVRENDLAHQLIRNGRGAAQAVAIDRMIEQGGKNSKVIDTSVAIEALVFSSEKTIVEPRRLKIARANLILEGISRIAVGSPRDEES